jgi:hypothetical protein
MCRSIIQLRQLDHPVSDDEIHAAALQYVRKISGYRKPSRANQAAFEAAVEAVATATRTLLQDLNTSTSAKPFPRPVSPHPNKVPF